MTTQESITLRLSDIDVSPGEIALSAADTLDVDDPFEEQVMDRLWEVFGGLESDVSPDWATAPVAQAALSSSAPLARPPVSASSLVDEVSGCADASLSGRRRSTGRPGRRCPRSQNW